MSKDKSPVAWLEHVPASSATGEGSIRLQNNLALLVHGITSEQKSLRKLTSVVSASDLGSPGPCIAFPDAACFVVITESLQILRSPSAEAEWAAYASLARFWLHLRQVFEAPGSCTWRQSTDLTT